MCGGCEEMTEEERYRVANDVVHRLKQHVVFGLANRRLQPLGHLSFENGQFSALWRVERATHKTLFVKSIAAHSRDPTCLPLGLQQSPNHARNQKNELLEAPNLRKPCPIVLLASDQNALGFQA